MSITRENVNRRMSKIVRHGNTLYLAGQVGHPGDSVEAQTEETLRRVEALLKQGGSSREHMLQATIWLSDMRYYDAVNAVWDAWVPEGAAPARACGEAKLANPGLYVEVIVVAAVP
ncbi:MAG: RidA family protein [Aquisalimonadaceae bacterium]